MATIQEIKNSACGADANGKSKAVAIIGTHICFPQDPSAEPDVVMEETSLEPLIELRVHGNFATIDLNFGNGKSEYLSMFYRCLERYLEETDNNSETQEATCFLTIIPFEYEGQYYITALNPVFWGLEATMIGELPSVLRIVFYADDIVFSETDMEQKAFNSLINQAAGTIEVDDDYSDDDLYDYGSDEEDDDDEYAEENELDDNYYREDDVTLEDERNYEFSNPDKYMRNN